MLNCATRKGHFEHHICDVFGIHRYGKSSIEHIYEESGAEQFPVEIFFISHSARDFRKKLISKDSNLHNTISRKGKSEDV